MFDTRRHYAAWQHRVDTRDEAVELGHVISEEFPCSFVGDLTVLSNETALELNVGLDRIHLWGVAERQNAPQVLLRDRRSNLARGRPNTGRRLSCERVLPVGSTSPVDRIFQAARNRPVVLRRDE